MKNLLLITYDFPPRGGGGVIRNTKFVKYLPQFGWNPHVLTVQNLNKSMYDDSLLHEIPPNTKIDRLSTMLSERFYGSYRNVILKSKLEASVGLETKKTVKSRIKDVYSIFEQMAIIPDNKISWLPGAITFAGKLIESGNIDVLMTSAPPHSTHLIGLALKMRYNIPWLIDFRDEWADNPYFKPKYQYRERLEAWMEKKVVTRCDYLIANTEKSRQHFVERYPHFESKITAITNGFDAHDFVGLEKNSSNRDYFLFSYVGSISMKRTPTAFFQALSQLFVEQPGLKKKIRVEFVGPFYDAHRTLVNKYDLQTVVDIHGNKSHKDGLLHMLNADGLLLLLNPGEANEGIVPGKTYEYLKTQNPILAIVPQGAVSSLVSDYAPSRVVSPLDVEGIKQGILGMVNGKMAAPRKNSSVDIFDRKNLTQKLAHSLERISE